MKNLLTIILISLACAFSVTAQSDCAVRKLKDLENLHKFFIQTGADRKSWRRIYREIKKSKVVGLELVASAGEAEMILYFKTGPSDDSISLRSGRPVITGGLSSNYGTQPTSEGSGVVLLPRTLEPIFEIGFKDTEFLRSKIYPAANFGKTFVQSYRRANTPCPQH